MEEIKVGEYVRTKNGKIRKIESTVAQYYITDKLSIMEDNQYELKDIVKHSFGIIDLVQVGDYVNGHLVVDKVQDTDDYGKDFITIEVESDLLLHKSLKEKHIKSIVTKEQFKNIEYEIN